MGHLGRYWATIEAEYPSADQLPVYNMPIESFGQGTSVLAGLAVEIGEPLGITRLLMYKEDRSQVCQLQGNWLAVNWRQDVEDGFASYQRYSATRREFAERYENFATYIKETLDGSLTPQQCEVTYVNHIREPQASALDEIGKVLRIFGDVGSFSGGNLEGLALHAAHPIEHNSVTVGRLHLTLSTVQGSERPLLVLNLTARGRPLGSGLDGILRFLDVGREAVVVNFRDVTTDEMHVEWGLKR